MDPTEFVSGICKTTSFDFGWNVSICRGLVPSVYDQSKRCMPKFGFCPSLLLPVRAKLDVLLGITNSETLYELRYRVPGSSG